MAPTDFLLKLTRLALNTESSVTLPADIDWDAVISLAGDHGLDAIALDGLQVVFDNISKQEAAILNESLRERRYDWMGYMLHAEQDYLSYFNKLRSLSSIFREGGFQVLLLKGYGLSLYYPIPEHRTTGDIDVYLYGHGEAADKLIMAKLGKNVKQNEDKHSTFRYEGVIVENHVTFLNIAEHPRLSCIEAYLEKEALSAPVISMDGIDIHIPSATMNAVFLPCHIAGHFVFGGIHIKQLMDWAVFVMKEGKSVDWDIVRRLSSEAGCFDFFAALNEIVIEHFGVQKDCLPDWAPIKDLSERVWADTLRPRKNLITRNFAKKLIDYISARWKYRLVYQESMFVNFFRHGWASFRGKYLPNSRSVWDR